MRLTRYVTSIILSGFVLGSGVVHAQSLGDVARKEEERRKAVGGAGKVYTNKDLPAVPQPATSTAPAEPKTDAQEVTPRDQPKDAQADSKEKDKDKPAVKDQAYWSERKKALQADLDRDQTLSDALQSRISALTTDFVNRADPAQRAVIEKDRQKALAELAALKKQVDEHKKALAGFEEEARRAGVPPGWLR
jgi:hypothetical protein